MNGIIEDIRISLRGLTRHRGFALAAVLSVALGAGANTTVFTLLNAILLRPLPVNDPARLAAVFTLDAQPRQSALFLSELQGIPGSQPGFLFLTPVLRRQREPDRAWQPAKSGRPDCVWQLLSDARYPAGGRRCFHPGRGFGPRRLSGGRDRLWFVDTAVRRRSPGNRSRLGAERPRLQYRRSGAARVPRVGHVAGRGRLGSDDDVPADLPQRGLGRPAPRPSFCGCWKAEAWRGLAAGRSRSRNSGA